MNILVYKKFPESNYREARQRYNNPAFRVYFGTIAHLGLGGGGGGLLTETQEASERMAIKSSHGEIASVQRIVLCSQSSDSGEATAGRSKTVLWRQVRQRMGKAVGE